MPDPGWQAEEELDKMKRDCNSFQIYKICLWGNCEGASMKTGVIFNLESLFCRAALRCLSILFEAHKHMPNFGKYFDFAEIIHEETLVPERVLQAFFNEAGGQTHIRQCFICKRITYTHTVCHKFSICANSCFKNLK